MAGRGGGMSEGPILSGRLTRGRDTDDDNPGVSQVRTSSRPSQSVMFGSAASEDAVFDFDLQPP